MRRYHYLIPAFILLLLFSCVSAAVAAEESDDVPGYDENTEVTIRGVIADSGMYRRGPVVLLVKADTKTYQVVTAPRWYLAQEGIVFTSGEKIEVTGSKYYAKDGSLSLIAHTIKFAGKTTAIAFRDGSCNPLWKQHRRGHQMRNR